MNLGRAAKRLSAGAPSLALGGALLAACGGVAIPAALKVVCNPGEHAVAGTCVDDRFEDVVLPAPALTRDVAVGSDGVAFVRQTLLVLLKDPTTPRATVATLVESSGGTIVGEIPLAGFVHARFADAATEAALDQKASALAASPLVDGVTRDLVLPQSLLARPLDTRFETLGATAQVSDYASLSTSTLPQDARWAFGAVNVAEAWDALYDDNPLTFPVKVAVLDTPIAATPVFSGLPLRDGHDLRPTFETTFDDQKHGTAVAAIIGAPNRSGLPTNGILSGRSCIDYDLQPIAITGGGGAPAELSASPGNLAIHALFYGVVYAVQGGARVVNLSVGTSCLPGSTRAALARNLRRVLGAARRTLFVLGAANDDVDAANAWPASTARADEGDFAPNIITVAAVAAGGTKAAWAQHGVCRNSACWVLPAPTLCQPPPAWQATSASCTLDSDCPSTPVGASNHIVAVPSAVTLAAPGSRVLSLLPDGKLTLFDGTSAATPMVSGAAGLLFAIVPGLSGEQAKDLLLATAQPIADASVSGLRLDVAAAVKATIAYQRQLAPSVDGQGDCGPKHPKPDTGHSHNRSGHLFGIESTCDCNAPSAGSYVEFTGEIASSGATTEKVRVGEYRADIFLGDSVALKAVPVSGMKFLRWELDCAGTDAVPSGPDTLTFYLRRDAQCRAVFTWP